MQVKILGKTLLLLELFADHGPAFSLSELTRRSGLPKSTTHRIATALCEMHLLVRDPADDRFRLGPLAVRLGRCALADVDLRRSATPTLEALARESGETVLLMALNPTRDAVVCLEQIESRHGLRLVSAVGSSLPLYAGGSSLAVIAHFGKREIDRVLAGNLVALTPATETDPARIRERLHLVRDQGYIVSFEETSEGVAGIASPIFDDRSEPIASVGIAGPRARIERAVQERLIGLVVEAGREISRALRGEAPSSRAGGSEPPAVGHDDSLAEPTTRSEHAR